MKMAALGLGVSLLAMMATSALAQDASEAVANAAQDTGDIVVTANRDPSLVSKTPIALSAITGEALTSSGIKSPTDLTAVVPNLSITRDAVPASGGGLQITIRGITSTDASEKGDPSAAFLRDGIYIARPQAQGVSFYDIERVEVLRGPQGTLYGRNTTAGVVNVIAVRPKDQFKVSGDFGYASFNAISATAAINVPVSSQLALRFAANREQRDSVVNPTDPAADVDPFTKNTSLRLGVLAKPIDGVTLYVQGDYSWIQGSGFGVVPVTNFFVGPFVSDTTPTRLNSTNDARRVYPRTFPWHEYLDNRDRGMMGELTADLGFGTLSWLASYRELDRDEHRHQGPSGQFRGTTTGSFWQHSEELRLSMGGNGFWKAQVGGYYFKEQSRLIAANLSANIGFIQDPTVAVSKALFAQATITPIEGLNLTGGVRYSHDDKSRVGVIATDPYGTPVTVGVNEAARSFSKTTWRLGADYDVPGLGLVYATVSTGYKAGGFNDGCVVGTGATCVLTSDQLYYKPETLTAYEAGVKWRLAGDLLRLNGAVFHYDYKNMQLSQSSMCSGVNCIVIGNAGKSKIDGVELEGVLRPSASHLFNVAVNWLDARYTEFTPVPTVSFAGLPLSRAPKWSLSAGYTFTHEMANGGKLKASVSTRYSGRYDLTDLATRVHFYQPSFTKTDVSLGYSSPDGMWDVQVFGRNLENNLTLTYARNSATGEAAFELPRSFGIRVGFHY